MVEQTSATKVNNENVPYMSPYSTQGVENKKNQAIPIFPLVEESKHTI